MKNKKIYLLVRESVKDIALSLFISSIFVLIYLVFFEGSTRKVFSLINTITIPEVNSSNEPVEFDSVKKRLKNYPNYGDQYATLNISSIGVSLPVYHGDSLTILSKGIGHYSGSYFPGEGGSIVFAGHNNQGILRRLPEALIGDVIEVVTTYGTFTYEITKTDIITTSETDKLPITDTEEVLMIYTCYPVYTVGLTNQRYVVYAKLVGETYEEN